MISHSLLARDWVPRTIQRRDNTCCVLPGRKVVVEHFTGKFWVKLHLFVCVVRRKKVPHLQLHLSCRDDSDFNKRKWELGKHSLFLKKNTHFSPPPNVWDVVNMKYCSSAASVCMSATPALPWLDFISKPMQTLFSLCYSSVTDSGCK